LPAAGTKARTADDCKKGTTDQAQGSLRKPEKIVNLGAKQIYVYQRPQSDIPERQGGRRV